MTLIRFGQWLPDLPDYDNPGSTVVTNLVPVTKLSYGPWKKPVDLSTNTMDARCQGAISGADYSGNLFTFTGDVGKLYRYTGSTFADVSKVGGYTSVAGYTDKTARAWHFRQFNNAMLATNFADAPQKWILGTDSQFSDMASTAPKAKYSAIVQNHYVLAYTDDSFDGRVALRLWFSPVGNPLDDDWGNVDKQSDFRTLPAGQEITGIVGGEYGIIMCRKAIYRMTYAGPPTIYSIDEINPQHGCTIPGSLAWNENRIFYHSEDGFQTMVGGGVNQPIGQDRVDEFFNNNVDQSQLGRVHSVIDEVRKLYIVNFPTSTSQNGTSTLALLYNYFIDQWALVEETSNLMETLSSPGLTLEEVGAIYPVIDDVPGSYENPAWQGGADFLANFTPTGQLQNFSGPNRDFTIDTPERQLIEGSKAVLRHVRPITDCGCPEIAIGTRDIQNDPVVWTDSDEPDPVTGLCSFRAKGRYHRARMTAPEGWSGTEVAGINGVKFAPAGRK